VNPLLDYARRRAAREDVLPRPPLRELLLEPAPACNVPVRADLIDSAIFHRFAVSAARLRRCAKPVILAISHSLGGGVAEYLRRLNKSLAGQAEFLLLTPFVILESMNPEYAFSLAVDPKDDYEGLLEALRQCGVARLHIQHVQGHVLDIHRLFRDLGVPFDFTVHDYFTICPQAHLNDTGGRYCGEPGEAGCNRCISTRPVYPPRLIDHWRRRSCLAAARGRARDRAFPGYGTTDGKVFTGPADCGGRSPRARGIGPRAQCPSTGRHARACERVELGMDNTCRLGCRTHDCLLPGTEGEEPSPSRSSAASTRAITRAA
jgi:hypothetical protein